MRVLCVEQKWGVNTDKGTPIVYEVTEQWESLTTATQAVDHSLRERGLTWTTRRLAADFVEVDVQDADDTLIALWDADALEKKAGMPVDDFCRFHLTRQGFFENLVEGSGVSLAEHYEKLGVKGIPSAAEWTNDFAAIERVIRQGGKFRGTTFEAGEAGRKGQSVTVWNAVLGFMGDVRPVVVWDGPDGPMQMERIGLGRGGGRGVQQLPPRTVFISWRMLRRLLESGHQCLVGGPVIEKGATGT